MAEFWQAKVLAWLTWTKSLFFWPNVDLHKWLGWLGKVSSDFGALCPSYQNLIIRLISCVNLLVNLRSMCLKVPTCIESFVILVAKVFSFLCVSFICISKSTQKENKFQKITARWRGILVLLFKTPDEKKSRHKWSSQKAHLLCEFSWYVFQSSNVDGKSFHICCRIKY